MREQHLTTTYHVDENSGFVYVDMDLLKQLGIDDKISAQSKREGQKVYLDEGADLNTLTDALTANNIIYTFNERVHYTRCFIHDLPSYQAEKKAAIYSRGRFFKKSSKRLILQQKADAIKHAIERWENSLLYPNTSAQPYPTPQGKPYSKAGVKKIIKELTEDLESLGGQ